MSTTVCISASKCREFQSGQESYLEITTLPNFVLAVSWFAWRTDQPARRGSFSMASWQSAQFCPQNAKYLNIHGSGMPSSPQHGFKRGRHELQKKAGAQAVPAAPASTVSTKITCHHVTTREANCHWKNLPACKNQKGCSNLKPHTSFVLRTSAGQKKERNNQEKLTSWLRKWFSVLYQIKVASIWHFSGFSHPQVGGWGVGGGLFTTEKVSSNTEDPSWIKLSCCKSKAMPQELCFSRCALGQLR